MFAAGSLKLKRENGEIKESWKFFYGPKVYLDEVLECARPPDIEDKNAFIVQMWTEGDCINFETKFKKIAIWEVFEWNRLMD